MTPLEQRGRTQFAVIIALGTLAMLTMGLVRGTPADAGHTLALYGRPLLLVVLGVLASHGRRWAYKVLVAFFVLLVLAMVMPIVTTQPAGSALAVLLVLGAVYGACVVLLLRSAAIRAFLQRPVAAAGPQATSSSGA